MTESDHQDGSRLDAELRASLAFMAPPASSTGVLQEVQRRVSRRRRMREVIGGVVVVLVGGGTAVGLVVSSNPQMADAPPAHVSTPSTTVPTSTTAPSAVASAGADGNPSAGYNFGGLSARPPTPGPCPRDQKTPTLASGGFCGPVPGSGKGLGPGGTCNGQETHPPCGPGVIPGRFYAYSMPGTCSALVTFDGEQWVSLLPLASPIPTFDVWIQLSANGSVRWIAPSGAVGLVPYTGQALTPCRG
jgi:hypothetical protein